MLLKIRLIFWVLNQVIDIICVMYHELWHWLFGMFWFFLGYINKPFLNITEVPKPVLNEDGGITTYGIGLSVSYMYTGQLPKYVVKSITIAPLFGVIVLFIIIPMKFWIVLIPYFQSLWLSISDLNKIYKID